MTTLLVKNASWLVTMDQDRRELKRAWMWIVDGFISEIGSGEPPQRIADETLDLDGHLVMPGLINTHHHFYQTLTRAYPPAQEANLFNWLTSLYPIWARMTPDDIATSTKTALAELALSGCTTASDHLYLFPNGSSLDDEIEAAREMGMRLHASRGSMSLGQSAGGLPPDSVTDTPAAILKDSQRLIEAYHDPQAGAMTRIVLAPCSPFSVTPDLMRESAHMARHYGVSLHTHLAETQDEEQFCLETFGYRPVSYMKSLDWVGDDVWFAHAVHLNQTEVELLAQVGSGVAHCPSSNMRLASGIAPIWEYLRAGVKIGLGVDGSASNDSSHLLAEARMAMLVARVRAGQQGASLSSDDAPELMSARQALELATLGGASVLGRDDIGSLAVGKCADFIAINMNQLPFAGALTDPVAAILFCAPVQVNYNYVHGHAVVSAGQLVTLELEAHVRKHNQAALRLVNGDA